MTKSSSNKRETAWNARYNELIQYKKRVGNCDVPRAHPMGFGCWVGKQRERYILGKMSNDRIARLTDIGFRLHNNQWDQKWEQKFNLLIEYKKKTGDCNINMKKTNQTSLVHWARDQNKKYKVGRLTSDRISRLEAIGFCWDSHSVNHWEEYFKQLVEYKAEHGHLKISWHNNQNLARWVRQQQQQRQPPQHDLSKSMLRERITRLRAIGFVWRGDNAPVFELEDDDSDTAASAGADAPENVMEKIRKPSADESTSSGGLDEMDCKKSAARGRRQQIRKGTAVNRQTSGKGEIKPKQLTKSKLSGRAERRVTQQTNQRRPKRLKQCNNIYCDENQSRHPPKLQCTDEGEVIKKESDTGRGNHIASIERRTSRRLLRDSKRSGGNPHPDVEIKKVGDASGHTMLDQVLESPTASSQIKAKVKAASENEDGRIEDEESPTTPNPVTTNPNNATAETGLRRIDYKDLCMRLTTKVFEQKAIIKTLMSETNQQKMDISLLKEDLAIEKGLRESVQCT